MSNDWITLVNTGIVPIGLIAIMFSMGLALTPGDFREVARNPRAVLGGLFGQLVMMPPLALGVAWLFRLPAEMATGLFILSICPGGITSNAITYAARANVALAVVLTTVSSLITVFSIPVLLNWALGWFDLQGQVPPLSVPKTMLQLAQLTIAPVGLGMLIRAFLPNAAARMTVWLRPASIVVLVAVIAFSAWVSARLVLDNLLHAGPASFVLNALGMGIGIVIARLLRLNRPDTLTVAIEVGIHNATMATFLTLSILKDISLAITPTIYGAIMVINAGLLVQIFRARAARQAARMPTKGEAEAAS